MALIGVGAFTWPLAVCAAVGENAGDRLLSSTLRIFLGLKPCARPEDSFFCNDAERLIER
jgi:hypothetical protein